MTGKVQYDVFFKFVGKKMRMTVEADSPEEAESIILNKPIEIVKTIRTPDPETIEPIRDPSDILGKEGKDLFNKLFGGKGFF